ncbi:MAG: aspartate--tRNA ligase [Chloroflexota bacterium]
MMKTHRAGELRPQHDGETVTLAGWVNRRRDQGGVIFIDLRDRWGVVQVVFNMEEAPEAHELANSVRREFVLQVKGYVRIRPEGTANPELETGEIEVMVQELQILNTSKTPPFYIHSDEEPVKESERMRYRYLDLRRPNMQHNMILRHKIVKFIRDYLDENGFLEIETPILFKTTPEGARDFLVPSRIQPGKFYALPQSPQQLKQLLMVGGYERYFQIARCFRDEDLRGDRQPEFTQLDLEMSFVEREDVMLLMEGLMQALVDTLVPDRPTLGKPFPRIQWRDAMEKYGTDRPDMRYDLEAVDIADIALASDFKVFRENAEKGLPVKALRGEITRQADYPSRTLIKQQFGSDLETKVRAVGAHGLGYVQLSQEEGGKPWGPLAKRFSAEQIAEIAQRTGAQPGDLIYFVSGEWSTTCAIIDVLRRSLAEELNLYGENRDMLALCWVIDFPLFEDYDDEEGRWLPSQHMFTMPMPEDISLLDSDPGKARGSQYDMILNGYEVGGGSIRIHNREFQEKIFPLIGMTYDLAYEQFGHMLDAFEYGAPPHGGMAWGIDRVAMLFANQPNIREVIAFPKTQTGSDAMAKAPSYPEDGQLEELHIQFAQSALDAMEEELGEEENAEPETEA